MYRLGLAIELIPISLDIVQTVGDHDTVPTQDPLDGRVLCSAGILFSSCFAIDCTREAERVRRDVVHIEAGYLGEVRFVDSLLQVTQKLSCTMSFAARRVTAKKNKLAEVRLRYRYLKGSVLALFRQSSYSLSVYT